VTFTVLFTDVASTDYYYAAIIALAQHGITAGCGNNGYCPQQNVTRDQMAIFMVRAVFGGDNFTYSTTPYFTDVTPTTFGFNAAETIFPRGAVLDAESCLRRAMHRRLTGGSKSATFRSLLPPGQYPRPTFGHRGIFVSVPHIYRIKPYQANGSPTRPLRHHI
jgi:hypothetical protein